MHRWEMEPLKSVLAIIFCIFLAVMPAYAAELPVIDRVDVSDKVVAISIENIQSAAELERLMSFCENENIRVTFFMKSQVIDTNRLIIKKAFDKGYEFGNYGVNNKYWGEANKEEITQELKSAGDVLKKVTGVAPKIVRPPFNYYENSFLQAAANIPDGRIIRGVDTSDWMLRTSQAVVDRVKDTVSAGDIISINFQAKPAAEALPNVVSHLKAMGYKITTVSEVLSISSVKVPSKPLVTKPFVVTSHIDGDAPKVALTFDDGGSSYRVNQILDILKLYGVPCTFFLNGNWVENNAELAQRIWSEGHEIANHSYSHPAFTSLGKDEMENEIASVEAVVKSSTGQPIKKYFRPPYGDYNSIVADTVKDAGYKAIILWDIDTRDWSGVSAQTMINRVLNQVTSGSIVLFHLHGRNTADAIAEIIPNLKAQGYILTTISNMLE